MANSQFGMISTAPHSGFFVYRHLGLLGCNIVLMKRFLPLLMLTGLLFGQDLLLLKSGKFYKGVFIDKVDENIIFNIEGDSIHTEISIYNVDIIKTDNGEYYYPFDIPTKEIISQNTKYNVFDSNILPKNFVSKQEIINMSEDEKGILYGKYKVSPFGNTIISFIVPTLGYHRINQWKQRARSCCGLYLGCAVAIILAVEVNNGLHKSSFSETEYRRKHIKDADAIFQSFSNIFIALHLFDVYTQTKKYNRNVYKYIFGQEAR